MKKEEGEEGGFYDELSLIFKSFFTVYFVLTSILTYHIFLNLDYYLLMEAFLDECIKEEVVRNIAYQLDFRYPDEPD